MASPRMVPVFLCHFSVPFAIVSAPMSVDVVFRGRSFAISLVASEGHDALSVGQFGARCASATGASFETLKLLLHKRTLVPAATPNDAIESAGDIAQRGSHIYLCIHDLFA